MMKTTSEWSKALINLVKFVNNFNYRDACISHGCVPFYVGKHKVGVILPDILKELLNYPSVFTIQSRRNDKEEKSLHLNDDLQTVEARDGALEGVVNSLREKDVCFSLRGWRDEKFSVYYKRDEPALMHVERSACPLFGFLQYGVHINGYIYKDDVLWMWVGKRAPNKPTYPGMLDNMCAGGLAAGLGIQECAIKECQEEGSVDDKTLERLTSVGTVCYCYQDRRGILPETQYVFDLELSSDFVPRNTDGEVAGFQLCTIEQIQDSIIDGKFKPNCALIIIDFLVRHGYLTPDNELRYTSIVQMMHASLQPGL